MKLQDLDRGALFQFTRQNSSRIHMAVDPGAGKYRTVGLFVAGEPKPFCPLPGCKDHAKEIESDRPERSVRQARISTESPFYKVIAEPVAL